MPTNTGGGTVGGRETGDVGVTNERMPWQVGEMDRER